MEIRAYNEEYMPLAQRTVGDMFDFAIVTLGVEANIFSHLFAVSDTAKQISTGNPAYIAGRSGCELARLVIESGGLSYPDHEDVMYIDKSPEYWAGWSLAYYQWFTGSSFDNILSKVPLNDIISMYDPYHEMDIEQFVDVLSSQLAAKSQETRLQYYRKKLGLSQSELSRRSMVPIRQIQLFEQRQRSINHTQAETLSRLSKALFCNMQDLMEQ